MTTTDQFDLVQAAVDRKADDLACLSRASKIAPEYGFRLVLAVTGESTTPNTGNDTKPAGEQAKREVNPNAPRRTGLTAAVRGIFRAYKADFTIRTIESDLKVSHPELAKGENLMVNISAILVRSKDKGELTLVTQGSAGEPSKYRNAVSDQTDLSANGNGQPAEEGHTS